MNLDGWKRRLLENRFIRSVGLLAGAAVIGQALMLAVTPLLTRLYSPADFGIFAAFSASMSLISVISSLRYELAIPLMRNDRSARSMLVSALGLNALTAVAAMVAVLLWREDFARLLNAPRLSGYLLLIPLGILGAGSYRALNLWTLRKQAFAVIAQTKLLQSASNVVVQIMGGFGGLGAIGLIVGHIMGFTAGSLRLARDVAFRKHSVRSPAHRRRAAGLLAGHVRFPKFDVPASLANFLSAQLPNLALVAMFSPAVAGIYFLAERVLTAPMSIVSQALGQTVLAGARGTIREGRIVRQTLLVVLGLVAMVSLPVVIVVAEGEYLFATIFDETWRQAGVYGAWLMPGFAVQFIYSSISTALTATRGQRTNLFIHISLLVLKIVALWVGYRAGDPLLTIIALGAANVVGGVFAIGAVFAHISWATKCSPRL
ncbi:MAG: oligosaccharide flippase family protein [Brevundimonas sp.]|nr:oligosaccharide flippase family protein [Brevundimonas sp.]